MKQSWTCSAKTKGRLSLWPLRFENEKSANTHGHLQHLSSSSCILNLKLSYTLNTHHARLQNGDLEAVEELLSKLEPTPPLRILTR